MADSCCSPTLTIPRVQPSHQVSAVAPTAARAQMVKISAGEFLMGTNNALAYPADGEGPQRTVDLEDFWIDEIAVTNSAFKKFTEATGYVTEAEKLGWSYVPDYLVGLSDQQSIVGKSENLPWWVGVQGANWRHPLGPQSSAFDFEDHPVVHISWDDANAYAMWMGKRLPTEAEWEKAARGGSLNSLYPWGDELTPNEKFTCNIWQGEFPHFNSADDGFLGTAPVYSYEPNGYGLYNVCGNVWEWCADWWSDNSVYRNYRGEKIFNPLGPVSGDSKVIKGGSYLCHDSYCNRYRLSARTSQPINSFTAHIGFRCAADDTSELLGSL